MTFDEFHNTLEDMAANMADSINTDLTLKVETAAMAFVDGNFTAQGWENVPWKPSTGTILVKTGNLRSGFRSETGNGEVRIYNEVEYAKIHNEGFTGTVEVKAHKRSNYKKAGRGKSVKKGTVDVKAHTRNMNMPSRQFAPYAGHESPTLNTLIDGIIDAHVLQILNDLPS